MKSSLLATYAIGLFGLSMAFTSCNQCETCIQFKIPMDGGVDQVVQEEEVCGRQDLIDKEDEIINNVTFDNDSVEYQTFWRCSED